LYEPLKMVPAVAPDLSGYTRQVSPARKFVFTPRQIPKNRICIVASGRDEHVNQLPDGKNRRYRSLRDLDGGVFVPSAWRIPSPHPFLPPRQKQGRVL
jgi:hypothetical protein